MPILLYVLSAAVFAQGTSEFMLAGLLPAIATELAVPLPHAGLLTSAFAAGMVIGAPVMATLARYLSPRLSLSAFLGLFILAHVIGALTQSFEILLLTRVLAALGNAGFLAVTLSSLALFIAPEYRARALAVILGGTTLALVSGVPAGAFLGELWGWRSALWAIVWISIPALLGVFLLTPGRHHEDSARPSPVRLGIELRVLRDSRLVLDLFLAIGVNAATFGAFTFLAPIAMEGSGLPAEWIPLLLALFGGGAALGVWVSGRYAERHGDRILRLGSVALAAGWAALAVLAGNPVALWSLVPLLGLLSFAVGSTLIGRVLSRSVGAPSMSGAFATVALNLGAVLGPVLAGTAFSRWGSDGPLWVSAALVGAVILLGMIARTRFFGSSSRI